MHIHTCIHTYTHAYTFTARMGLKGRRSEGVKQPQASQILELLTWIPTRAQPGGHFPPSTSSECVDVLFAGSGYEPSTICSIWEASQFHVPVIF